MPRDLDDLLAAGAPRDPGSPDLATIESRAARRRTGGVAATVVAVLAAAALAVQVWPSSPETPIIDEVEDGVVQEDGTTVLPLPDPGAVLPAHANGRPVFVVHAADGAVRVLDAISPHDSDPAALKVLAYCQSSGWFEDPWHGSKFSDNGAWTSGPSPYGLATHAVVEVGTDTVTVGRLESAPARGTLPGAEPAGPDCGETGTDDGVRLDDLVIHADVTPVRVPGLLYPERPDDDCCGLLLPDDPQAVGEAEPVTIVLPNTEDVAARHIDDRPVFAIPRTFDDSPTQVVVLDGIDPHQTGLGPPKVLTICTDLRVQETVGFPRQHPGLVYDPWYLSRFSPDGTVTAVDGTQRAIPTGGWIAGPAPNGLARYPVLGVEPGPGDALEVTVLPQRLPPPPRVDLGLDDVDDEAAEQALRSLPSESCNGRDQLFPDMPPADPTLLDDLVLHEPLHPELWWYATPARLLGEEPGLPPAELERYLERIAADRVVLDLADLPAMGDAGLAVQVAGGIEFTDLDGRSIGILLGAELVDDTRDGHGGAIMVRDGDGVEHWVAPSNGTTMPAEGTTPFGYVEDQDGTWATTDGFLPPLEGPLHVGNMSRHITGPRCDDTDCPVPTIVDLDMGGAGTTEPACVATDGFGDLNHLEVCTTFGSGTAASVVVGRFVDGERRWDMPRYVGQPDDVPTIGHFRDALFGPSGVVAQLSLECEIPAVVLLGDDGSATDPWGADTWERGPTSVLLGTTVALRDGPPIPLAQVVAGACGDNQGVEEGVWALTADGPQLLNGITDPVVLWTEFVGDLDALAQDIATRAQ